MVDDFVYNIGRKIAKLRKERHLSQEELAEKSNKIVNTISKLERGIGDPKILTLKDVADALDIDLQELIDVEEKNSTNYKKSHEKTINRIEHILRSLDEQTLAIAEKQIEVLLKLKI